MVIDNLQAAATELVRQGVPIDAAWRQAMDAEPDAARAWHHGHEDLDQDAGMADPGALLQQHAHAIGQTFAASCAAFPALAASWHRGELVRLPRPRPAAGETVLRFRAALEGDDAGDELLSVPVFKVGTWNSRRYVEADLDAMVDAAAAGHFQIPIKLGHDDRPDTPAVGRVAQLWREGGTLYADFADVDPEVMAGIRSGRWLTLSCEIALGMERAGKRYRAGLVGVALLGGAAPGVDLPPLREAIAA